MLKSEAIVLAMRFNMASVIVENLKIVLKKYIPLRRMIDCKTIFDVLTKASFNSKEKAHE